MELLLTVTIRPGSSEITCIYNYHSEQVMRMDVPVMGDADVDNPKEWWKEVARGERDPWSPRDHLDYPPVSCSYQGDLVVLATYQEADDWPEIDLQTTWRIPFRQWRRAVREVNRTTSPRHRPSSHE